MRDKAQGVDLFAVDKQVDLYKFARAVRRKLVVEGGVAARTGFEGVEKVVDNLVEGHFVVKLHEARIEVLHILELPAPVLTHGHNGPHVVVGRNDGHLYIGFLRVFDRRRVGVVVGVVDANRGSVGLCDFVNDGGQRRHEV